MPAGISSLPPSSFEYDKKNSPAFTIIPRDNFSTTLPILHLNHFTNDDSCDDYNQNDNNITNDLITNKIIKNNRNNLYSRKRISKSNDHLILANLQCHQTNPLKKNNNQSKSHDQLHNGNEKKLRKNFYLSTTTTATATTTTTTTTTTTAAASTKSSINLSMENFNDVLTEKLNKVEEQNLDHHQDEQLRKMGKSKQQVPLKKPFITTVKTGEFLLPPPEVAAVLGVTPNGDWIRHDTDIHSRDETLSRSKFRPMISFNRRPEVRHNSHNARCQAALKATVDFAVNIVNSSNATTASTFARAARRLTCNNNNNVRFIENDQSLPFGNIMFDRRVVRGSTIASASLLAEEQSQAARQAEARRKQLFKKRSQIQTSKSMMLRLPSPPPLPGRKHEPVQTELYLEELIEKPGESEVATQTDNFIDRPSTPPFCCEKTGVDAETQINPGDLFDYDVEVQPLLEVLVGQTIEQALIEVLEEEELATMKEQQRRFLELRAAEKAEALRLEQQDRRLRVEKERCLQQHEEALKIQQETEERVAAAVLLTGYIAELLPTVLDGLKVSGYLLDEMKSDTEVGFMPWLVTEVKKEMDIMVDSRELLSDIIREIIEKRAEIYRKQDEDYDVSRLLIAASVDDNFNIDELEKIDGENENIVNYNYSMVPNDSNDV